MNNRIKDITGIKYNLLTAVNRIGSNKHNQSIWLCLCDCGIYKKALIGDLNSGHLKSCGCLNIQSRIKTHTTHGLSKKNKLYKVWDAMKARCYNKNHRSYKNYGGRGIFVCKDWQNYENFHVWSISAGYMDGLSIDRVDNDRGYSPDNCKWVEMKEQVRNRRITKTLEYNGELKPLAEWCEVFELDYHKTNQKLLKGWTFEKVLLSVNLV